MSEYRLTTFNARSESITTKRSFSEPLKNGKRCVLVADGYYEWYKKSAGPKKPYFLYPACNERLFGGTTFDKERYDREAVPLLLAGVYECRASDQV